MRDSQLNRVRTFAPGKLITLATLREACGIPSDAAAAARLRDLREEGFEVTFYPEFKDYSISDTAKNPKRVRTPKAVTRALKAPVQNAGYYGLVAA